MKMLSFKLEPHRVEILVEMVYIFGDKMNILNPNPIPPNSTNQLSLSLNSEVKWKVRIIINCFNESCSLIDFFLSFLHDIGD